MSFPIYEKKYDAAPLFTAGDFLHYMQGERPLPIPFPRGIIFCYQNSVTTHLKQAYRTRKLTGFPLNVFLIETAGGRVGVIPQPGFGAPAAVVSFEICLASGATHFISLGTAGTLQASLQLGDLVVCREAIRDEGTSYHYLPPAKYASASTTLTSALCRTLEARGVTYQQGSGWTTDAVYRETVEEITAYAAEGVLTVDMEAAALFSVAACRQAELAVIFTVSDQLCSGKWQPGFFNSQVKTQLNLSFDLAVETLLAFV